MKNHNVLILIVAAMLPGAAPLAAQCQMAFKGQRVHRRLGERRFVDGIRVQ